METYEHKVQYYETDKMGIAHHSNYIRWMEEARVNWLEQLGWGMDKLENLGMISPVVNINCQYINSTKFNDNVKIRVYLKEYRNVKLIVGYEMENSETGDIVAKAESTHCFLKEDGKPVVIKKEYPEFDEVLKELL